MAASIDVSPVGIDLAATARSTELHLTNTGNEDLSVQIDVREWSQDLGGADQLVETQQLLAVPPLVTIPPGKRQVVRIGHLGAPAADHEKSFRLLVTELAPPASTPASSGLRMRMQLSIPVFVAPTIGAASPDVVIDGFTQTADGAHVSLHNVGNAHAKIEQIQVRRGADWWSLPAEALHRVRYLLPATTAGLDIPAGVMSINAIRITSADGGEWEHAMPLPQ